MAVLNPSISPAPTIVSSADKRTGALALAREELKDKFHLRLGVYLLLGGLWFYGVLLLQDAVKVATTQLKAAQSLRLRAESVAKEGDWAARALLAKEAVIDAQGLLWREESAGLAQALVNDQITKSLTQARIIPRLLNVANVIENKSSTSGQDVMTVRAKIQFEFKQSEFYAWLEKLARDRAERKPSFVIDAISVRGLPAPLVEVDLIAYVLRAKVPKAVPPPLPLPGQYPTTAGAK